MSSRAKQKAHEAHAREHHDIEVVHAYLDAAAEVYPDRLDPSCCVNGTRIAIEVLKRFDIHAQPLVTEAFIENDIWHTNWIANPHPTEEQAQQWVEAGAYSVGVMPSAPGPKADGYNAHLVAVVHERLIDSSAGQFNRPAKGIVLPATLVTVPFPPSFFKGETVVYATDERWPGVHVGYHALLPPYDALTEFRTLPGWQLSAHNLEIADEIVDRMRGIMAPELHSLHH